MPPPFAVLLMASGGPGGPEEIEAFLTEVRGGAPSPAELAAVRQRYQRVGGRSPVREITEAQRVSLGREVGTPVYAGMRHGRPSLAEAVDSIVADGHRRVVGLVLAPHYSASTVGDAEKKLLAAAKGRLELGLVRSWGDHIGFVRAVEH
ncbi:MAG: ferrochelatase, partial [Acidimicrobiales bacterium]